MCNFLEPHLTEHLYYQFSLCSLMSIDPNNDFFLCDRHNTKTDKNIYEIC